ncbi:MAG: NosD domain-containing protein [Dehalococcoidales bacterium]|nr:NosD domain-containing protein [Dehalococcoidales bacterium]
MKHRLFKNIKLSRILSMFLSLLMAIGALSVVGVSPVLASDVIYLGSEGWSVPVGTWDSATQTAGLIQNISNSIEITSDHITLDGNGYTISGDGSGDGVYAESKHDLTIRNLTIINEQNGIKLYKTHNSIVENNTISNTERGIYLYEGALISVLNNQTFSNTVAGISIRAYSHENTIEGNESYLNHTGIKFEGGFFNTVRNNVIRDNTATGLTITDDWGFIGTEYVRFVTNYNQIYNNNFINNPTQSFVYTWLVGENNVFYLDLPTGGNYWSNWTSPDGNQDGLVDNPYVLYGVQDNLPWASFNGWLNSPTTIAQDVATLVAYFGEAVREGTLVGSGPGKSAMGRLGALQNMLVAAYNLIENGQYEEALEQLTDTYEKLDGNERPPDFAIVDDVEEITAMILELIERLQD